MMILALKRFSDRSSWLLWSYLAFITLAELVTSIVSPQGGLILHVLILVALTLHGAFAPEHHAGRLALALTLAPLIRLLSLSMPLLSFPQMAWYPVVSIPLLIAMWIVVRQLGVKRHELGLQPGTLPIQLMLIGSGIGLGVTEYVILQPKVLLVELTWQSLWLPALSLIIFTGFTEEVIFRGLLQTLALPALGRWSLLYVSLLFGVLHVGYLSTFDVIFVSAVGLLFAYLVHWGRSILGVTLAHGLTNIMLFLIMPYVTQHPDNPLAELMPWIVAGSTIMALCGFACLLWLAGSQRQECHKLG